MLEAGIARSHKVIHRSRRESIEILPLHWPIYIAGYVSQN
jgi:hypothetical protein